VVNGLVVAACLTATGVLANVHRGLADYAQSHDRTLFGCLVLFLDVSENAVGFWKVLGLSESLNQYFPYFQQLAVVEPPSYAKERDPAECGQSVAQGNDARAPS
jgi:hypothetical protein